MGEELSVLLRTLVDRYRQYLETTVMFRDEELQRSFSEVLGQYELVKGPFIELTPRYRQTVRGSEIFAELLGIEPEPAFAKALQGDRVLYAHQEQALRRAWSGRNVVVATGTGSGKTEAFLLPILLDLYREHVRGQLGPGVRALILYPMNALAFDQRERLAEICRILREQDASFRFTFGQYTGSTPEDAQDDDRHADEWARLREPHTLVQDGRVLHGEMVFRKEIRTEPPHILITNYSMLEYLLIRPLDSPLFDNGRATHWKYLVIDEAHVYTGTRGQELALLFRRLKQRLRNGGRQGPFCCIATSATLFTGEAAKPDAADFASRLFGEPFTEEDVIEGQREKIRKPTTVSGGVDDSSASDVDFQVRVGFDHDPSGISQTEVWSALAGRPALLSDVAKQILPNMAKEEREAKVLKLLEELADPQRRNPNLPASSLRLHVFVRGLEGAFIQYVPYRRVFLTNQSAPGALAFELALCRECGQHYLVGRIVGSRFQQAIRDYSSDQFDVKYLLPLDTPLEDIEPTHKLCAECGTIVRNAEAISCHHRMVVPVYFSAETHDSEIGELKRCLVCDYSGFDPVREVIYGAEGPQAVISSTLFEMLPDQRRKILAFADGRQDAASFAVYLDDWCTSIFARQLLYEVLADNRDFAEEGLSLSDLSGEIRKRLQQRELLPRSTSAFATERESWAIVLREYLAEDRSTSLEGVGLARWRCAWLDECLDVPDELLLPPWSLSVEEAREVLAVLIASAIDDGAVTIDGLGRALPAWDDLGLRRVQRTVRLGRLRGEAGAVSWDGAEDSSRPNRRVAYLEKVLRLRCDQPSHDRARQEAQELLRVIWEWFQRKDDAAAPANRLWVQGADQGRRLNPRWWRLCLLSEDGHVYRCRRCRRVTATGAAGVCPRYGCSGQIERVPVASLASNLYWILYRERAAGKLRVEEHTAQLTQERAREFQRAFSSGELHVLSCSTTFELGVDLGDVDVVLLRNVPPEPFNYIQRAGRVGRRDRPGLVITYCRRRPHDLYYYQEPESLLEGVVRAPLVRKWSEKVVERHVAAVVLAHYFRKYPQRFSSVEALIGDWERPTLLDDISKLVQEDRTFLLQSLELILPKDVQSQRSSWEWLERVLQPDERLTSAVAEVCTDYLQVREFESLSDERKQYSDADWANRRARTIAGEDVLSFLSRKVVIPKYGFPVDVVELSLPNDRVETGVELERDLRIAIAEFAPSARVIANKREWISAGIKIVRDRQLPLRVYRWCQLHMTFAQREYNEEHELTLPCGCDGQRGKYLVPLFGFFSPPTNSGGYRPQRVQKLFTTRPVFAENVGAPSEIFELPRNGTPILRVSAASPGRMVVLSPGRRGQGFWVCTDCGAASSEPLKVPHKTRSGQPCKERPINTALGHDFITDVVQLQFLLAPSGECDRESLGHSLVAALTSALSLVLQVPRTEVAGVVGFGAVAVPLIVLYDDVPGGGGVVARLEDPDILLDVLKVARDRVRGGCGCGPLASCYGCLRTYGNQFVHDRLQRGPVFEYLDTVLARW